MSKYSVHVSGLAPSTTEAKLHDFFTFCGTIQSIDFKGSEGPSTIYFERPTAVHTALMLNGGTLDGAQLTVTSDEHPPDEHDAAHPEGTPISQSDKPRAGIAAEYLAKGYQLSDQILQRAIELDNKKGISKRFLDYIHSLDTTLGQKALGPDQTVSGKVQEHYNIAAEKARAFDEQKGVSKTANDYYLKALSSPFGQKVKAFYTGTTKQVLDIHEEARRIAEAQKAQSQPAPAATTTNVQTPAAPASGHPTEPKVADPPTTNAPTVV